MRQPCYCPRATASNFEELFEVVDIEKLFGIYFGGYSEDIS